MPVTTVDPITALVAMDLQQGIVALPTAHPTADIIEHTNVLIAAFRRHGSPVVLVNVNGAAPGHNEQPHSSQDRPADWAELAPQLDQQLGDLRFTKQTWRAFSGTDLHACLKQLGVTQVVLAGIVTSMGVESTARQAHELGYNVTLAVDSMTDMSASAHHNSVARIFPKLGETGSSHELVERLNAGR
jgi:nicotinamidase-related amidase